MRVGCEEEGLGYTGEVDGGFGYLRLGDMAVMVGYVAVLVMVVISVAASDAADIGCDVLKNTRKYRPDCSQGSTVVLKKLLVTGSGGCGSHSTSEMFAQLGLDLPHEDAGRDGAVSWLYAVDAEENCYSSKMNCEGVYPYRVRHWNAFRYEKVFHQTRCPLNNIGAILTHTERSHQFVSSLLGVNVGDMAPLER